MDICRYPYTTNTLRGFVNIGFAIIGNPPFMPTGYGTQCRMLGESLVSDGFPVCHISDWSYSGAIMDYNGVKVYPVSEYPGTLKSDDLVKKISHFAAQEDLDDIITIFLGDLWKWNGLGRFPPNSIVICPVDGSGLIPKEVMEIDSFDYVASMSKWGSEVIEEYTGAPPLYLPHGFDPELQSAVEDLSVRVIRSRWTELLTKMRVPLPKGDDAFIVGFFGDFSVRKEPEINLLGFRMFVESLPIEEREFVKLYLKGKPEHPQSQSSSMYQSIGIPSSMVLTVADSDSHLGLTTEQMARLLKGVDVLLHCSSQEGFGIFQIEAQAVGTPVINTSFGPMTNLNAFSDLCLEAVKYREVNGVKYGQADPKHIADRLAMLYQEWKDETLWISRRTAVKNWAQDWSYPSVYRNTIQPALQKIVDELKAPRIKIRPPIETHHVAFVSTFDTECGIATYTRMLANSLIQNGVKVSVLAEVTPDHPVSDEPTDYDGVSVYRCWSRNAPNWVLADEILNKIHPDVLHAQHEWTMIGQATQALANLISNFDGARAITWHTPDFPSNERARNTFMLFDSVCDLHILHNRSKVPMMASQCMNGVTHIDHGILSIEPNPNAKSIVQVGERVPMLFTYGFLSGGKGVHTFLKAALKAVEKSPYFEVVAYGGAHPNYPTHPDLLKECHDLADQSEQIYFIPKLLSEEEIDLHCNAADFLVFPYEGELLSGGSISSSSGAVFRVLDSGKPIICSDEGRLRDIIGGIHGWKVAQGDSESLSEAIADAVSCYLSEPSRYNKMRASVKQLSHRLSWNNVSKRHINAYRKASKLWGVYSSNPTAAFSGIQGEHIDFMDIDKITSSTGSEEELTLLADDLNNLPTPPHPDSPVWDSEDRTKMIEHIDSIGGDSNDGQES